jgi:high-affinity nickel-transport protein
VASATLGVQVALILAGFFAMGMVPMDTLDSIILRSAFSRIFDTKGFRYMAYSLSVAALTVAAVGSYETITKSKILPEMTGPILAMSIILVSFGYAYTARKRSIIKRNDVRVASPIKDEIHTERDNP